jgi:2-polyprenyl-6-methoxyphenol hydroxylase-like FAD-dependent oxidoreductase
MSASPSPLLSAYPDVVVVGTGMGGLSFALSLLHYAETMQRTLPAGFRLRLLERDESATSARASQGYTLSIRCDAASGGVQVLDRLGLMDDVEREATTSHGFAVCDASMRPLMVMKTAPVPSVSRPGVMRSFARIRRYRLRELMLTALQSRVKQGGHRVELQFNSGVASATEVETGDGQRKVELTLLDGRRLSCDLVIAADGASSKVRHSLVPADVATFNSAYGIGGEARFGSAGLPELLQRYHLMASDGCGHGMFLAALDGERANWFVSERRQQEPSHAGRSQQEIMQEAMAMAQRFAEPVPTLFAHTAADSVGPMNCKDKKPTRNASLSSTRIILIGDAAHAISPFAGNGANMALMDGEDLALLMLGAQTADLPAVITRYDQLSVPRNERALSFSHRTIASVHSTGLSFALTSLTLRVMGFVLMHGHSIRNGALLLLTGSLMAGIAYVMAKR